MNKITHIGLVFENCEVLEVDATDILKLDTDEPKKVVSGQYGHVSITEHLPSLYLALHPRTEPTGGSFMHDYNLSRLNQSDVTGISFLYDDGTKVHYTIDWPKNSTDYTSTNQFYKVTETGITIFTVSRGFPMFKEEEMQEILESTLQ